MRVYSSKPAYDAEEITKAVGTGYGALDSVQGYIRGGTDMRRALHWDIEDAARNLSWVRASLTSIGRSLVGPGYTFKKVDDFEDEATDESLKVLKMFYGPGSAGGGFKQYKNFKDYYTTSGKFYATAVAIAMGGSSAWEIKTDRITSEPVDFDYIPGYVEPNLDTNGGFNKPAFRQFLSVEGMEVASWESPDDIVFFSRPDFGGYPFASDLEALVAYTLPSDIYAALSWLAMHKNRNAPLDGYWQADAMMQDTDFRKLEAMLRNRYTGARNYGRSPLLARGNLEFKRVQRATEEAPYVEGRKHAQKEISAVTGVHGSKLGLGGETGVAGKDAKRDYYENVVEPMHQLIEEVTYEQVHVRRLGIRGWKLSFNNPAFLNEVEQASVDRTYWNIGESNANEIRAARNKKPREGGDVFFEPANMVPQGGKQVDVPAQGPNPGTSDNPVAPAESHPSGGKPRPVRADEQSLAEEIRKWKTVALKCAKNGKPVKPFETEIVPAGIKSIITRAIVVANGDVDLLKEVFRLAEENING
jgi:hypothetical protein